VRWLGVNYSGASAGAEIRSAWTDGNYLHTDYAPYDWPEKTVQVRVDAIACFFYQRGSEIVGGKFEWWRAGGQSVKGLHNVHEGYNGHEMPGAGTQCWTCIVSVDGRQRSNVVEVEWR